MVPGRIDPPTLAIVFLSVAAIFCDLAFGRIFNWLTGGMALAAIIYAAIVGGFSGIGSALLGMLAAFLLYSWMFWLGILGGGDVKLLMAFGAWGGSHYILNVAAVGMILGGAMAVIWLVAKGRVGSFFVRLKRFLMCLFIKELEVEKFNFDKTLTMPFGVPIAIAAVLVRLDLPFLRLGL